MTPVDQWPSKGNISTLKNVPWSLCKFNEHTNNIDPFSWSQNAITINDNISIVKKNDACWLNNNLLFFFFTESLLKVTVLFHFLQHKTICYDVILTQIIYFDHVLSETLLSYHKDLTCIIWCQLDKMLLSFNNDLKIFFYLYLWYITIIEIHKCNEIFSY